MKPIPDCIPDALRMILATARVVSDDDFIHRKVLIKAMAELADDGDLGGNPADLYLRCWETAGRSLGVKDPYENEKARGNKAALGILKALGVDAEADGFRLEAALNVSFAGSMIDFSGLGRSDIEEKIEYYLGARPASDAMAQLAESIEKADAVMIVADRAGEIAMDRPLAELMARKGKTVHVAVAARPVFALATEKDAEVAGYAEPVRIVNPGTAMYGLVQDRASNSFRDRLDASDVVIAKGDIHFCTMSPQDNVYYILKARDDRVAAALGIDVGAGAVVKGEAQPPAAQNFNA